MMYYERRGWDDIVRDIDKSAAELKESLDLLEVEIEKQEGVQKVTGVIIVIGLLLFFGYLVLDCYIK